jgi:hypothetical protein
MLIRSGEAHFEAEAMAIEIARIYVEEARGPFPYEGCRWLRSQFGVGENLIPNLDMWFSAVAGFCSRGKRLLSLFSIEIPDARGIVSLSFFDKHPEYALLERHITADAVPDLYEALKLYERMRTKLLELLDFLLDNQFEDQESIRGSRGISMKRPSSACDQE